MRFLRFLPAIALGILLLPVPRSFGQPSSPLRIVSPRPGATVSGTVSIVVEAAEDLDLSFLVFGIDGSRPVAMNTRPFVSSWDTRAMADGPHILFIEAHGPGGMVATAGPIQVIVRNQAALAKTPAPRGPIASRVIPTPHPHAIPVTAVTRPQPEPAVMLCGKRLATTIRILSGEAYLPVRPLIIGLGGTVAWDQETHTATMWRGQREVRVTVGNTIATLNGAPVKLYHPPTLDAGRTLLPARACGQLLDLSVAWDALRRYVLFTIAPEREKAVANQAPSAN